MFLTQLQGPRIDFRDGDLALLVVDKVTAEPIGVIDLPVLRATQPKDTEGDVEQEARDLLHCSSRGIGIGGQLGIAVRCLLLLLGGT